MASSPDAPVAQFRHARARVFSALQGLPVSGGLRGRGVNITSRLKGGTAVSPQVFTDHPRVNTAASINPNEVGLQAAAPVMPGRLPVAGWDGETGAQAPAMTKVY